MAHYSNKKIAVGSTFVSSLFFEVISTGTLWARLKQKIVQKMDPLLRRKAIFLMVLT
jgi:hypothetical protein